MNYDKSLSIKTFKKQSFANIGHSGRVIFADEERAGVRASQVLN